VGVYIDAFKEVSSKADSILFISISEEWTPAFDIAKQARESIPYTEVELMDARTSIGAQGLIALEAARAAASGQELAQVVKRAEEIRKKVNMIATPDTLYYLAKGGRIGTASRLLGSMLSVKPIVELRDIVRGVERVRTRARAVKRLAEIMKERAGTEAPVHVIIDEADCLEEAEKLRNRISDEFNCAELYICELSPVPGAHLGPGTLGLSFYAE
jgi:DegV family protein with EDD domain